MATTYDVELYVYDLSQGFAAMMSEPLLGKFSRNSFSVTSNIAKAFFFEVSNFSMGCQIENFRVIENFRWVYVFEEKPKLNESILGFRLDAIYHTAIVVYGKEYYYGGGISGSGVTELEHPGTTQLGMTFILIWHFFEISLSEFNFSKELLWKE